MLRPYGEWGIRLSREKNQTTQGKKRRSRLSRQMVMQYFLALAGYVAGLVILVLLAWQFLGMFTWYGTDLLYQILHFIKEYILLFMGVIVLAGWTVITYYFISKPLRYMDEIVEAAKQLAAPTEHAIVLSSDLSETANELNLVRERALHDARIARESEQRKNDLIVYLAHDLKTPLTSVIGYLTLLRDERQISEELQEKYLAISLNKAERLEELINEFFDITRFNLSHIPLEQSKVNLTRMLEQIVYEFQPMFAEKHLQCKLSAPADVMLLCDADKMERVFDNLLRNAVNYSFEDSEIHIMVEILEQNVKITVANQGNTIPQEKLERIFEQFFRLDSARNSRRGGSGLGLAIAKEIVERHHGSILAHSDEERITFTVILPLS